MGYKISSVDGRTAEAGGPFEVWSSLWRSPGMWQGSQLQGSGYTGLGQLLGGKDEQAYSHDG